MLFVINLILLMTLLGWAIIGLSPVVLILGIITYLIFHSLYNNPDPPLVPQESNIILIVNHPSPHTIKASSNTLEVVRGFDFEGG